MLPIPIMLGLALPAMFFVKKTGKRKPDSPILHSLQSKAEAPHTGQRRGKPPSRGLAFCPRVLSRVE